MLEGVGSSPTRGANKNKHISLIYVYFYYITDVGLEKDGQVLDCDNRLKRRQKYQITYLHVSRQEGTAALC